MERNVLAAKSYLVLKRSKKGPYHGNENSGATARGDSNALRGLAKTSETCLNIPDPELSPDLMQAPQNTSRPRILCPTGPHLGRLVQLVDLGSQRFKPQDEPTRKLYLGFETSGTTHIFDEKKGPEPFMIQVEFAFFMVSSGQKKTKLRTFIESWRGRPFGSDQEASQFDFEKLLGQPALLTISHERKADGSLKSVIAGICQPMAGQLVPKAHNPLVLYEIAHGEGGKFTMLPPFLRKKIQESEEFKRGPEIPETQEPIHDQDEHEWEGDSIPDDDRGEIEDCPF